jgi:hypothetical protein
VTTHTTCACFRSCHHHLPPTHLQDRDQSIDLARPAIDIITMQDEATALHAHQAFATQTLLCHAAESRCRQCGRWHATPPWTTTMSCKYNPEQHNLQDNTPNRESDARRLTLHRMG